MNVIAGYNYSCGLTVVESSRENRPSISFRESELCSLPISKIPWNEPPIALNKR